MMTAMLAPALRTGAVAAALALAGCAGYTGYGSAYYSGYGPDYYANNETALPGYYGDWGVAGWPYGFGGFYGTGGRFFAGRERERFEHEHMRLGRAGFGSSFARAPRNSAALFFGRRPGTVGLSHGFGGGTLHASAAPVGAHAFFGGHGFGGERR